MNVLPPRRSGAQRHNGIPVFLGHHAWPIQFDERNAPTKSRLFIADFDHPRGLERELSQIDGCCLTNLWRHSATLLSNEDKQIGFLATRSTP